MKYATSTLLLLAPLLAAQSIEQLPPCSLECLTGALSGVGCSLTDFKCSCQKSSQLTPALTPCIQTSCKESADQEKVVTVLEGICAEAGFPIDVPHPSPEPAMPEPSVDPEKPAEPKKPEEEQEPEKPGEPEQPEGPEELEVDEKPKDTSVAPTIQTSMPTPTEAEPSSAPSLSVDESCIVSTITLTVTGVKPTAPSAPSAPYPTTTGPVGTGSQAPVPSSQAPVPSSQAPVPSSQVPVPSGSKVHTSSSSPPEFTGAASGIRVPAAIAGAAGVVAYFL